MLTKENIDALEKGAKTIAETAVTGVNTLTAEAINLFIIQSALHVLKFASIFILFYMVKKYLMFLKASGVSEKVEKSLSLSALIISVTFFVTQSFPHLMQITEALVAPNVFLIKKGAEFYKESK